MILYISQRLLRFQIEIRDRCNFESLSQFASFLNILFCFLHETSLIFDVLNLRIYYNALIKKNTYLFLITYLIKTTLIFGIENNFSDKLLKPHTQVIKYPI